MLNKLFYAILLVGIAISHQWAYAQKHAAQADQQTVFYLEKGAKITLHCNSGSAAAYQWYKNSIKMEGAVAKDLEVTEEGIFSVIAFNEEGCASAMSDDISVQFATATHADLAVDLQTSSPQVIPGQWFNYQLWAFNNSTTDAVGVSVKVNINGKFLYQPDVDNPLTDYDNKNQVIVWNVGKLKARSGKPITLKFKAIQPGDIDIVAGIEGAQSDPLNANNTKRILQQVRSLTIPNVFTPNGDGVNDTFAIPGLESFAESEIVIANKAGANVFVKKNYQNDWAGENLPEGTYFYLLKLKNADGSWQVYKSYITLLRSKL